MNRYIVTNLRNGQKHAIVGTSLPDRKVQPGWGQPPGVKPKDQCDVWELANGASAGTVNVGTDENPVLQERWSFPDSMEVVETNIDAEISANNAKKTQHENRLAKMLSLSKADLKTAGAYDPDKVADALLDIAKALRRMAKGD